MEELSTYWNLDECTDRKLILNSLKKFKKDGKIDYEIKLELLKLEDIDMCQEDITSLLDMFEKHCVFEDLDISDDDDDFDEFYGDDFDDDY